jgi:hypothetical protein
VSKLQFYGINGRAKLQLEPYLNNIESSNLRRTTKSNEYFYMGKEADGVPQGSFIGPIAVPYLYQQSP